MNLEQEIWVHCTDTDKRVKGKVVRLYNVLEKCTNHQIKD